MKSAEYTLIDIHAAVIAVNIVQGIFIAGYFHFIMCYGFRPGYNILYPCVCGDNSLYSIAAFNRFYDCFLTQALEGAAVLQFTKFFF